MPGKKAAKKSAAKKAAAKKTPAKKMAAKHAAHGAERDLRRAYEHMGRLEALRPMLANAAAKEIETLLRFAQSSLGSEDARSAAELLRAGEHLAFGSLAASSEAATDGRIQTLARAECEGLLACAADHWERHREERASPLDRIYEEARTRAEQALGRDSFRRALEFARAAEALGHVQGAAHALSAGQAVRTLRA